MQVESYVYDCRSCFAKHVGFYSLLGEEPHFLRTMLLQQPAHCILHLLSVLLERFDTDADSVIDNLLPWSDGMKANFATLSA